FQDECLKSFIGGAQAHHGFFVPGGNHKRADQDAAVESWREDAAQLETVGIARGEGVSIGKQVLLAWSEPRNHEDEAESDELQGHGWLSSFGSPDCRISPTSTLSGATPQTTGPA